MGPSFVVTSVFVRGGDTRQLRSPACTEREGHEGPHSQAVASTTSQPWQHLGLGLPASRTIIEAPGLLCLAVATPADYDRRLLHWPVVKIERVMWLEIGKVISRWQASRTREPQSSICKEPSCDSISWARERIAGAGGGHTCSHQISVPWQPDQGPPPARPYRTS